MMPLWNAQVHKEPLLKRYYSGPLTNSFAIVFVCGILLLGLPLYVAYNSWGIPYSQTGFWYKESVYYEQPILDYRHQGVVEVHGQDSTGSPINLYYSTSPTLNQQQGSVLRAGIIESASFDENHDGINDRVEFKVTMPLQEGESVNSFNAMFFHDVRLRQNAKVAFDSISYINYNAGDVPVSRVSIGGDVVVRQKEPFSSTGGYKVPYGDRPLLPVLKTPGVSASSYSMRDVLSMSANRHVSTHFSQSYVTAQRAVTADSLGKVASSFETTITMRLKHQPIRVKPAIAEVLKVAWAQYMPMFLITAYLLHRFLGFVLGNSLVAVTTRADVVVQKED